MIIKEKNAQALAAAQELRSIYPANIAAERGANIATALMHCSAVDLIGLWPEIVDMVSLRRSQMLRGVTDWQAQRASLNALRALYHSVLEDAEVVELVLELMKVPVDKFEGNTVPECCRGRLRIAQAKRPY